MRTLSRQELIELVRKIINVEGTEEEIDEWEQELKANVPHPEVSGLIFYPEDEDVTPEEIVDEALSYKPIALGGGESAGSNRSA